MMKTGLPFLLLILWSFGCSSSDSSEEPSVPLVVSVSPQDGTVGSSVDEIITVTYSENVVLADNYQVLVNDVARTCGVNGNKLTVYVNLEPDTEYRVVVPVNAVKNSAGNFAGGISFSFKTAIDNADPSIYEAEDAVLSSNLKVESSMSGYSGTGYVAKFENADDQLTFNLTDIGAGDYDLYLFYNTSNWGAKLCTVTVNNAAGSCELPATNRSFASVKYEKIKFSQGANTIVIRPDYNWFAIDYIRIVPYAGTATPFDISDMPVTPDPSSEALNLYHFLKNNFQQKILSGTMANYSTNIDEAEWVHGQTGKWPALTCFDYIDHTNQGTNWVQYEAVFELGSAWWSNNGIVALMWHWRDPLTKSGAFYTDDTSFDVSKITDTGSDEYKAMIADIDLIAGYLKEFKDAHIPVLWRPLHEAQGGWFWWGAKGPDACKALWKLMFDRLVNYHGLDNLIWVWTTQANDEAAEWYPGDACVDIIGMDIYPGENQHQSRYLDFDKVRELFGGRKILTLAECGSAPDPGLMMEYGDTWSWFMPWNGDFTRAPENNGTTWWNTFFSYDFVLTRDQMPDLK